jgi:polysaccharide export outer membrane protein
MVFLDNQLNQMKISIKVTLKITALIIIVVLTSCVPQKKILYFQDTEGGKERTSEFINQRTEDYLVQPGDNLFVRVRSLDEETNAFDPYRTSTNYYSESGIYLNSYSVNDSGFVSFPLIGDVEVKNFTINEIQQILQSEVDEYIKNAVVIVKLVNFRITMIGEFKQPGKYLVYQDDITIFQAIAMAGDLTDFAKRDRIVLIRQTKEGSLMERLDLNDKFILESDYFYLMPNDIVYAEPIRGKQFVFSTFPYALIISMITLGVVLWSSFN